MFTILADSLNEATRTRKGERPSFDCDRTDRLVPAKRDRDRGFRFNPLRNLF